MNDETQKAETIERLRIVRSKLVREHSALKIKLGKLSDFLSGNLINVTPMQRRLLILQVDVMQSYLTVLELRIEDIIEHLEDLKDV